MSHEAVTEYAAATVKIHQQRPFVAVLACLFSVLAACGNDGGGGGDLSVQIGTGIVDFEALSADQELELFAGPQGGHHFIVHARAMGIEPGDSMDPGNVRNPSTQFMVFDEAMTRIDARFPPYRLGFNASTGGWQKLPSGRILQVLEETVVDLYGGRALLRVEIEDANGRTGSDDVWIRVIAERDAPDAGL